MMGRKAFMGAGCAAALLAAAACASGPRPESVAQDIEFLRGCWVAKTESGGQVTGFLRLLPEGAAGTEYGGEEVIVDGATTRPGSQFAFARDGSRLTIRVDPAGPVARLPHARVPGGPAPGDTRASFGPAGKDEAGAFFVIVDGSAERLQIVMTHASGAPTRHLVDVERDGCD